MANQGGIQATIEASPDEIYDIELEHDEHDADLARVERLIPA